MICSTREGPAYHIMSLVFFVIFQPIGTEERKKLVSRVRSSNMEERGITFVCRDRNERNFCVVIVWSKAIINKRLYGRLSY